MGRVAKAIAAALGTSLVFVLALVAGVCVHLRTAAVQRVVVQRVNQALAPLFVGTLTIERVGSLGLTHVGDADARVDAVDGTRLARATGVAADVDTAVLVRSLLRGAVVVDVPRVSIDRGELDLDSDAEGIPLIADAFLPRTPSPPSETRAPPPRVSLEQVHIGHLTARGRIGSVPLLDGDLDDTEGQFGLEGEKLHADVSRTRWTMRRFAGLPDAGGEAEGHLVIPSGFGDRGMGDQATHAVGLHVIAPQATVGTVAVKADFAMDGERMDAVLDVPGASPEEVRSLGFAWAPAQTLGLHAEAHGTLPRLTARAHTTVGAASLDLSGPVTLGPATQATLQVDARKIDARALAPEAPRTAVDAKGDVSVTLRPQNALDARVALEIAAGEVSSTPTPPLALKLDATRTADPAGALSATARLSLREPGAPTVVVARLTPKKRSFALSFQAESNIPDLAQVRWARGVAQGTALAKADGVVDLGTMQLDGRLTVASEELHVAGARAAAARMEIHGTGSISAPSLAVAIVAENFEAWRLQCPWLQASAQVGLGKVLTFDEIDLATRAAEQRAHARVGHVRVAGASVDVEDARVTGFGAPITATVRYAPRRLYVRAASGELELTRIARFIRVGDVRRGEASLDVDATVTPGHADGRIAFDVKDAAMAGFDGVDAKVEATLHGRQAAGHVTASVAGVGSADIQSSSVQVGEEGALSAHSWRRAWGAIDAKAHIDLPSLVARLPQGTLPLSKISGVLDFNARIDRDSPTDASPGVDATIATTGLVLAGTGNPPWRFEGVDPFLRMTVDGETGATAVEFEAHDATGSIVRLDATSNRVPYATIATGEGLVDGLLSMPVDARLTIPDRAVESLPASLGFGDDRGRVDAELDWHGSVRQPNVHATGTLSRGTSDPSQATLPVDLALTFDYDGARATATVQGMNRDKLVLDGSGVASVRSADLLAGLGGASVPWTGSARAKLDAVPLRLVSWLTDRQVRGRLSGDVIVDGLHDDAHAKAALSVQGLAVGNITCRSATLDATLDGHAFDAKARVEQQYGGGFVEAGAHIGTRWGAALRPSIDVAQAADLSLTLKHLRAALLSPFVSNVFTELDGQLDGAARLAVDPGGTVTHPDGTIELKDGLFELASIGGEFGDVSGKLVFAPDGLVRLEGFSARGLTGKLEAAATARFAGLRFGGATATVQMPKNQAIPLVFDGVQIGQLDGRLEVVASAPGAKEALNVKVDIPTLHLSVPTEASHDVQPLGPLEGVTIGAERGPAGFVEVPLDIVARGETLAPRAPITIALHLGDDVTVVRGSDVNVRLSGDPVVTIADEVTVTGQIRLVKGTIQVQGKPFEIEKGVVTFEGKDPSNPQVVVTAEWTAPDATRIYADFSGPLKTGKVTLRSDPVLPGGQSDILALILYGQTTQAAQSSTTSAATPFAAAGASIGPVSQALSGLNRTLSRTGLSARIDTSQSNPMPEVQLQVARDISVRVGEIIGVPTFPNLDTTIITLAWAIASRLNLESTVGVQTGSTIFDLVWQKRF